MHVKNLKSSLVATSEFGWRKQHLRGLPFKICTGTLEFNNVWLKYKLPENTKIHEINFKLSSTFIINNIQNQNSWTQKLNKMIFNFFPINDQHGLTLGCLLFFCLLDLQNFLYDFLLFNKESTNNPVPRLNSI
jgi:hypothetical protein